MKILKAAVLAAAFAGAAIAPSFAADGGREDGQAWLLDPGPVASSTVQPIAQPRATVNRPTRNSYQIARDMNMSGT